MLCFESFWFGCNLSSLQLNVVVNWKDGKANKDQIEIQIEIEIEIEIADPNKFVFCKIAH